jgi:glycosyltransferase involved in cell wall biosynthesis
MKPVSIVMIAYNEADHIEKVIREYYNDIYLKLPKGSEYIFYLDKPTDNTPEIVKNLSKELPGITIFEGGKNLGYAGAMKTALKKAKNNIVFYSDSSSKHVAKDFWRLLKLEKRSDIITGLRNRGTNILIRKIVTAGQKILISLLFFIPPYDFNTGYKLVHKEVIEDVIDDCRYMKQSFSSEFLIRAYKRGYTIRNASVEFNKREGENTGTSHKHLPGIIWKSFLGFLKLKYELLTSKKYKKQKK